MGLLLGKGFTSKFKGMTSLAVSRIVILKRHHTSQASYDKFAAAQLWNLGCHDRALYRVELWIIEQNMLEVFAMIENYCNFLRGRVQVLKRISKFSPLLVCSVNLLNKHQTEVVMNYLNDTCILHWECPVELEEATSSLIFASSRFGKFPELHKIREILTSKFGKEFADHAVELHTNNRVNSMMMLNLSPTCPTMEVKLKVLSQIASEIGVTLHLEHVSFD